MKKIIKESLYQIRYGLPVWLILLSFSWFPDIGIATRIRGIIVSLFLPGRPKKFRIGRDVTLLSINRLYIGSNVYIAKGCWINAIGGVNIGNEVVLSPYVVIASSNHGFKFDSVQKGGAHLSPIVINIGSWIASHAVISAGVVVGKGNIVGANSVVTKNTPDNVLVAGVPAKIIKNRIDNPSNIFSKHDICVV